MKLLCLILTIILIFSGCTGRETDKSAQIRWGFTSEPSTFDPLKSGNTADGRSILFNVFEGLVKPGTDGIMQPCIASSWSIEQGGLVYNFILRDGVCFHDGSAVTPSDVKFSLETAAASGIDGLDRIEKIELTGSNNIKITLTEGDLDFLPYLTIGIVKAGNNDREKNITGTGPFFIESYTAQRNLVLKKFDNYWNPGFPLLDTVTIVFFENTDAMMLALRGGGIDGANITGTIASQLNRNDFEIENTFSAAVQLMALNNKVPPLDNVLARRAINYAVDVKEIIDTAFFGIGIPSGSPIIPGLSAYYEDSLTYTYDPQTSLSLLAQAGIDSGFTFEITVPSNYTMHVDTAQVIASQLGKIGINVNIKLVDWATWLSDVYFGRQYTATIISLDSPVVSPRSFLSRYRSQRSDNFMNFSNAEFDRLIESILAEENEKERIALYKEAQRVIAHNAAGVYIQDILYLRAYRKGAYSGFRNYPLYVVDFSTVYATEIN